MKKTFYQLATIIIFIGTLIIGGSYLIAYRNQGGSPVVIEEGEKTPSPYRSSHLSQLPRQSYPPCRAQSQGIYPFSMVIGKQQSPATRTPLTQPQLTKRSVLASWDWERCILKKAITKRRLTISASSSRPIQIPPWFIRLILPSVRHTQH